MELKVMMFNWVGFDFTEEDLKEIEGFPKGFFNSTWKNDSCPSMECESVETDFGNLYVKLWIDYADFDKRETMSEFRFCLQVRNEDEVFYSYETNSWQEVLKYAPFAVEIRDYILDMINIHNNLYKAVKLSESFASERGYY